LLFDIEIVGEHGHVKARTNKKREVLSANEVDRGTRGNSDSQPTGSHSGFVPPLPIEDKRAEAVRAGFIHAFGGYRAHAWGDDEFKPRSGVGKASVWGGMGMMILDAMDTAMIMGLEEEYTACVEWIRHKLDFSHVQKVSYFETTIRALGGLLSAYALSAESEPVLLQKAEELARMLAKAKSPTGSFPARYVTLSSGRPNQPKTSLAEVGSSTVELRYLSAVSGESEFSDFAHGILQRLVNALQHNAMIGVNVDANSGKISGHTTLGGASDSFYEYLVKSWVQGKRTEPQLLKTFLRAMSEAQQTLVHTGTGPKKLRSVGMHLCLTK